MNWCCFGLPAQFLYHLSVIAYKHLLIPWTPISKAVRNFKTRFCRQRRCTSSLLTCGGASRKAKRDKLYDANINPIATFPAEGIVIFGQKTLQVTPSALDRINVRRLMVFVKKEISRMATQILFDQNVQATWSRFLSLVMPFLRSVKARFGLDAYKVVLSTFVFFSISQSMATLRRRASFFFAVRESGLSFPRPEYGAIFFSKNENFFENTKTIFQQNH